MALFEKLRHNCATLIGNGAMDNEQLVLKTITIATAGVTLAELLAQHPTLARRTVQRWIGLWLAQGRLHARGAGRARHYFAPSGGQEEGLPSWVITVPLSPDSKDVLSYVEQPLSGRKPVGYQPEFLQSYQPGSTWYLPLTLRRQLHKMGQTVKANEPAGTYSRDILSRLLIDLSWASSHLEGNTYSRLDTRELIEHGTAAQGKGAIETQMILNHKSAIELLVENIADVGFDRFTLMNLHSALAENLLPNPADEGRIRQHAVDIGLSVFRPLSVPAQIEAAFDLMLDKVNQITDPFEQSFFIMVHLPYLQPFADINKRTSRLAANLPLFRANLCPLTFLDVPESAYARALLGVYEMTRVELLRDLFVWAYERSTQEYLAIRQDLVEPDPLRLAWRDAIKQTIREVILHPDQDAMTLITAIVATSIPRSDQADVRALIADELRRLHEGVLARYGLRPSEFTRWKSQQN